MPFNVCPAGNQAVRTTEPGQAESDPDALASDRLLVHDWGRTMADVGCAGAGGAEVISDFGVMGDQEDLSGVVALMPTAWMRRSREPLRLTLGPLPDQGGSGAFTRDVKASELGRRELLVLMLLWLNGLISRDILTIRKNLRSHVNFRVGSSSLSCRIHRWGAWCRVG